MLPPPAPQTRVLLAQLLILLDHRVAATAFRPPRFGQRFQRICAPGPSPFRQVRGIQTLAPSSETLPSPVLWANSDRFTAPQVDEDIEVGIHASEAST